MKDIIKYLYLQADVVREQIIISLRKQDFKAYEIHKEKLQSIYDLIDEIN